MDKRRGNSKRGNVPATTYNRLPKRRGKTQPAPSVQNPMPNAPGPYTDYRPVMSDDFLNNMDPGFFSNSGFGPYTNESQAGWSPYGSSSHQPQQQVEEEKEETESEEEAAAAAAPDEEEEEAIPETQEVVKRGKRACRNWTKEEEMGLAKGWLNVSEDPYHGNQQTGNSFWRKVAHEMNQHVGRDCGRGPETIRSKWKDMKLKISGFCGIYNRKRSRMSSGQNDEDVFKASVALYMRKYGNKSGFPHVGAWNILKDAPKWAQVMTVEEMEDLGNKRARTEGSNVRSSEAEVGPIDLNEECEQEQQGGDDAEQQGEPPARPVPPRRRKGKQPTTSASTTSEEFLKMVADLKCETEDKKRAREEKLLYHKQMLESYRAAEEARKIREEEMTRMVQSQQRQSDMDFVVRPHDHLSGAMLEFMLAQKREICAKYGWPMP